MLIGRFRLGIGVGRLEESSRLAAHSGMRYFTIYMGLAAVLGSWAYTYNIFEGLFAFSIIRLVLVRASHFRVIYD